MRQAIEDAGYEAGLIEDTSAVAVESGEAVAQLSISGLTCASCVNSIESAMRKVPGVLEITVNLMTGMCLWL